MAAATTESPSGAAQPDQPDLQDLQQAWEAAQTAQAAAKMANLVESSMDNRMRVNKIQVIGIDITKDDLLEVILEDVLQAKTLGSLLDRLQTACGRLQELDLFQSVAIELDAPQEAWAPAHAVDVRLHVKEKSRLRLNTGTYIGSQEGSLTASATWRNVFGRGERLQVNGSLGTRSKSVMQVAFSKPIRGDPSHTLDVAVHQSLQDWANLSGFQELQRGMSVTYKTAKPFGRHSLAYELVWRELTHLPLYASLPVREHAGHSLKSALRHVWTFGTEDDVTLPRKGYQVQLSNELAGLGGNVNFTKHELHTRVSVPLPWNMALSATARAGALFTLTGEPSRINDRFFLGGPLSVRGFRMRGLGPQAPRYAEHKPPKEYLTDALGGDLYWSGGVSLFTPLPVPGLWNRPALRLHHFVNAGLLAPSPKGTSWADTAKALGGTPSVSAGVGIVLRTDAVRVELNYCFPLWGPGADRSQHGLHLGIGLSYL